MSSCEDCGIQFENYDFLMDHKNSLKILKCKKCPKMFPNACERYVHTTKKQCQELLLGCNYCNMKFANNQHLDKHKSGECEIIAQSGDQDSILINLLDVQEKLKEQNKILAVQNFYDKNPCPSDSDFDFLANQIGAGKKAVDLWFKNIKSNAEPSTIINKPITKLKVIPQSINDNEASMEEENIDDPEEENIEDPNEENVDDLHDDSTKQPSISANDFDSSDSIEENFQKSILEQFFNKNPFPSDMELSNLAIATNIRERVVKVWFKKKRESNEFMEVQQESLDIMDLDKELQRSTNALPKPPVQNDAQLFNTNSQFIRQKNKRKSKFQLDILERTLAINTHPDKYELKELSALTGLEVPAVKNWFINNRNRPDVKIPQRMAHLDTKDIVSKLFQQETVETKELDQEEKLISSESQNQTKMDNSINEHSMLNQDMLAKGNLEYPLGRDDLNEHEDSNKEKNNFKLVGEIKFNGGKTSGDTFSNNKILFSNLKNPGQIEGIAEDYKNEDFDGKLMAEDSNEKQSKRVNQVTKHFQREILETAFENLQGNYPNGNQYESLVISTGMTKDKIKIWFQNKKVSLKKRYADLPEHMQSGVKNFVVKQRLSHEQKIILENEFSRNQYPWKYKLEELSKSTGLTSTKIYQWFTNKRTALKAATKTKLQGNDQENFQAATKTKLQSNDQENFQIYLLESAFKQTPNPNPQDLLNLSKTTQLELPIVKTWFTNRRAKWQNDVAETSNRQNDIINELTKRQNDAAETANRQNDIRNELTKRQTDAAETANRQNDIINELTKRHTHAAETANRQNDIINELTANAEVSRMPTPEVGKRRISPQLLFSNSRKAVSPPNAVSEI